MIGTTEKTILERLGCTKSFTGFKNTALFSDVVLLRLGRGVVYGFSLLAVRVCGPACLLRWIVF